MLTVLLGLLAAAWWRAEDTPTASSPVDREPHRREAFPGPARRGADPTATRGLDPTPPRRCTPRAAVRCFQGDVWSFDGCGERAEKLDECEARLCRDALCEEDPDEPCHEPESGRCDGERVRLCYADRPRTIDCGAQGLRCTMGEEGAECAPPIPPAERCAGPARCEGGVLVRCVEGQITRVDCGAERATCGPLDATRSLACVKAVPTPPVSTRGCEACGCPADPTLREERCDGQDDDGDGLVDEDLDCGVVPVMAFVVTDRAGRTSYAPSDIGDELTRTNAVFADTPVPGALTFVLEDVTWFADDALGEVDASELNGLADDPRVHPVRDHFYVPLLFTDSIALGGGTPKAGSSTLPNGTCGGIQEGAGPDVGVVVVSKGRSPTTVAHELGHFLGLCHTHDVRAASPVRAVSDPATHELRACDPACSDQGDGICDTPFDPGPELCPYDALCEMRCGGSEPPDATNLMSYYTECRRHFSDEQVARMQHTLALRRGWSRCLDARCACALGSRSCPVGMSCRPMLRAGQTPENRCALDGPRAPGAGCQGTDECGQGGVCLQVSASELRRCVRACTVSVPGCRCLATDSELHVCAEDIASQHR